MRTILVLWLFLIHFSTNTTFVVRGHCAGHQESSLLHLKNSLLFNPSMSKKLVHWNQSYDCCQWNGITCSEGRVIALDLSGESISGGIDASSSLFDLQSLQNLNLAYNDFNSLIPSELHKLKNLRYLNFSNNVGFKGQIPESFVSLTNLTTLQLSSCNLSGVFPKKIFQISNLQVLDLSDNPNFYGSLPNFPRHGSLQVLNISHTSFSGELPNSIHNLRKLSTLDLSNCQFNETLPISSISELIQLVHLDLSYNNFIGPLPSFNKSKSLSYVSFFQNHLEGEVPSSHFEGLENLKTIDLANNFLNGTIPSSLFTLASLQKLLLSYNGFEGVLGEFPNASSSAIEMLDISGNNFQGHIPMSVFHLGRLKLLQLASNRFTGTIHLDVIGRMENLVLLDLSHNNLSVDATFRDIDHNLSSFPKLTHLSLASCKLREFPSFLRKISSLCQLDLSSNQIHGRIPNWIWRSDFLAHLNLSNNFMTNVEGPFQNISSNLFVLDLHSNQLQGPTPIFSSNIFYLDLSNNRFNSIAPLHVGNYLSSSYFISLANNSFHGKIPESFCNISSTLMVLDLSYNSFNDTIPVCLITRMSGTIRALNLGGNNLKGQIHDTFPTSCALRLLDLNQNSFGGTIPRSLANCQQLQVLNIGNNQFIDRFPCFLRNISTLRVMTLRSNKFHGSLECPISIGDWEALQIVDLASNNFSGMLPVKILQRWKALTMLDENNGGANPNFTHLSFNIHDNAYPVDFKRALSFLNEDRRSKLARLIATLSPFELNRIIFDDYVGKYGRRRYMDSVTIVNKGIQLKFIKIPVAFTSLDFSSNHFKGSIPEELMSFKALRALNLSQNTFSGYIPSSVRNLKYLESLDLSMNCFSGNIPIELATISFLEFLNLSYNHLVGPIPTGTQIQSFEANSFKGNEGLCGPPLTQNCTVREVQVLSPPTPKLNFGISSIDWNFLSVELGFTFGLGIVILPIIFWEKWRLQYFKFLDYTLWKIFPQLHFVYEHRGGKSFRLLRWN